MTTLYKAFRLGRIGPHSHQKWPKRIGAWVSVDGALNHAADRAEAFEAVGGVEA